MRKNKKKEKLLFVDDGRVIADMNVDGMRRNILQSRGGRPTRIMEPAEPVEALQKVARREERQLLWGAIHSWLIFGLITFGIFAAFIYFCIHFWFK